MSKSLSNLKRQRQNEKRHTNNKMRMSELRTFIKKATNDPSLENIALATKYIDKAQMDKIIHKNFAARKKSKVQSLEHKK